MYSKILHRLILNTDAVSKYLNQKIEKKYFNNPLITDDIYKPAVNYYYY